MKKRILKIFKWTLIITFILIMVLIGYVYSWISNRSSMYFTNSEMVQLTKIVNSSPKLTNQFYKIYDKIKPDYRSKSMNGEIFNAFLQLFCDKRENKPNSPCRHVYHFLRQESKILKNKKEWKDEYKEYLFGWGINNYTTPEKCFDYNISKIQLFDNDSTTFNKIKKYHLSNNDTVKISEIGGIYPASLMLFGKELKSLNEDEIIELIVRFENPRLYTRNRDLLEKKIKKYKELILR